MRMTYEEKPTRMVEPQDYVHHILVCSGCGGEICKIVESDPIEDTIFFRGQCPCGDFSYIEEVKGTPHLAPAEGVALANFVTEELEGKVVTTIQTKKVV